LSVPRILAILSLALLLGACAGNFMQGLKSTGHWLVRQPDDRPEEGQASPTRNDAASYSAYLAERDRLLNDHPLRLHDDKQAFADPAGARRRVLQLAPVGTDIDNAKISLELNGFACGWIAEDRQRMRCNLSRRAGTPAPWQVVISNQANQVGTVVISPAAR
jgi:hypothetical protein